MKIFTPVIAALLALAVVSTPAVALPLPPATSDKLMQIATAIEGMHGPSRLVDQRMADMLRPLLAAQGVTVPATANAYTQYVDSVLKLRPKGWQFNEDELLDGRFVSNFAHWEPHPPLPYIGLTGPHDQFGSSPTSRALAASAAVMKAWAEELREQGQ